MVKLDPQTGRRHQLRKHLASIANPILGDKEYGIENLILNGKGLYLHAYSLGFAHNFIPHHHDSKTMIHEHSHENDGHKHHHHGDQNS